MDWDVKINSLVMRDFLLLPKRCQEIFMFFATNEEYTPDISYLTDFKTYLDGSQSAIETIFHYSLCTVASTEGMCFLIKGILQKQAKVDKYRPDFLFDFTKIGIDYKLVVECDGHDFHEKTKKQVQHDNERDLFLKQNGYDILHFSGSQIYNEPLQCAYDTLRYAYKQLEKARCKNVLVRWLIALKGILTKQI